MFDIIFGVILFPLLVSVILPFARMRQVSLGVLHMLLRLGLLAALGACAVFHIKPDLAPAELGEFVRRILGVPSVGVLAWAGKWLGDPTWAFAAIVLAVLGWLILTLLDAGYQVSSLIVYVKRWNRAARRGVRSQRQANESETARKPGPTGFGDLEKTAMLLEQLHRGETEPAGETVRLRDVLQNSRG